MIRRSAVAVLASFCCVVLVGCQSDPLAPRSADGSDLEVAFNMSSAPVIQQVAPIIDEFGTGAGVSGQSTLTRTSDGVWLDIAADGLTAGNAYTIWAVVFDNSLGCGNNGCGVEDLGTRQAQVTLVNAGGFVAGASSWAASGHLDRHDVGGKQLLRGDAKGVDNTYRAEIHFIIRSHGVAETDPANLAAQTSQVGAFCNLPVTGCEDQGVSVFAPPGAPGAQ